MSLAALFTDSGELPVGTAIWSCERTSWAQLGEEFRRQTVQLSDLAGQRVGLALEADCCGIASLAALESLGCDVFLLDGQLPAPQRATWGGQLQLAAILPAPDRQPAPIGASTAHERGSVTILTSGTTGQPKAVRHSWAGLTRPVRRQHAVSRPPCWLLAFRPHLYAGLQVMLQALLSHGTLVVPPRQATPNEVAQLLCAAGVQFASATPSYWRRLLMSVDAAVLGEVPLVQITLGGEVVDQATLDRLAETFPSARLAHIYATTELGRCFSVTDRRAGFPQAWLGQASSDGVELQVRDYQLWVRSANAMSGYDLLAPREDSRCDSEGWMATGDLVELHGDRVFFVGRNSEMINVGGNKVYPVAVERVIRQLPEVAEVRVYAQQSSLAGQLVACQIVAAPACGAEDIPQKVRAHCQAHLDRFACPRLIEVVDQLPLSDAGKLIRPPAS